MTTTIHAKSLSPEDLYHRCDPAQFSFETTDELDASIAIIGQERALAAIKFGIGMTQSGYNLFALGPNGVGKQTAVFRYLDQWAKEQPLPPDWCYVQNFDQTHQPDALRLPPGKGLALCQDMEHLVDELFTVIPAAFESEEYQVQKQTIEAQLQQKQEEALEALNEKAKAEGITLIKTQQGLAFAPYDGEEVISPEAYQELEEEKREKIEETISHFQDELQKLMRQVPHWSRESREDLEELSREMATYAVSPLIDELKETYEDLPEVVDYLDNVQEDVIKNVKKFLMIEASNMQSEQSQNPLTAIMRAQQQLSRESPFFNRYQVNLLVDNSQGDGAPVVFADHPTFANLNGRMEHMAQMGALITDLTMIKAGALHRANGGCLILDARKLLLNPQSWESLKRALQSEEIHIEPLSHSLGLISTVTLEPEPIPLDVKVVLLGDRQLYYLLHQLDPDFSELFKVAADFEDEMVRDEENNHTYAQLISSLARKEGLRHFDREAVASVIEHSSRLAGDGERLSTHMQTIADLLREASYWAEENGNGSVHAADVQNAIDAQKYRNGRLRDRIQEAILRDTIYIDTKGAVVGQINGLAIIAMGEHAFGRPNRITARVSLGKGEVIDIERQVEMGGPIHSKGVMILSGFLGGRYAAERPLSLKASLVFEQSYSGVDGDSASSAELYALLSALAETPIKQSLAVTGSVNQRGRVQAIGGVNDKIEGFYDICYERGLTGSQGVLIPQANVKNLMLRQDVVEAAEKGDFHIYPVATIDEGIEILTGIKAGERDENGRYPPDTINRRVTDRLDELAQTLRNYQNGHQENESSGEQNEKND